MKKFITIFLIMLCITPVFAKMTGTFGVFTGYTLNSDTETIKISGREEITMKGTEHSVPLYLKGNILFGNKDLKMGIDYGLKFVNFPIKTVASINGNSKTTTDGGEPVLYFAPQIGFGLGYDVGDNFSVTSGFGLKLLTQKETLLKNETLITFDYTLQKTILSFYASVGIAYAIDPISLLAGVDLSFPIFSTATATYNISGTEHSSSADINKSGIEFTPYIGLGINF